MICRRCGKKVDGGWRFCPNCGSALEHAGKSLFDDMFSRFRRELKETDRTLDNEFEVLDLSQFFRSLGLGIPSRTHPGPLKGTPFRAQASSGAHPGTLKGTGSPRGSGFTIKITKYGGKQPSVDVKTSGNVNLSGLRKDIAEEMRSMGIRTPATSGQAEKPRTTESHQKPARVTEEPKTHVRSVGTRLMVEMELPNVISEGDIGISELESSVEVRARAGDTAYFKIITKPEGFSVTTKRFEKGMLHLEFS